MEHHQLRGHFAVLHRAGDLDGLLPAPVLLVLDHELDRLAVVARDLRVHQRHFAVLELFLLPAVASELEPRRRLGGGLGMRRRRALLRFRLAALDEEAELRGLRGLQLGRRGQRARRRQQRMVHHQLPRRLAVLDGAGDLRELLPMPAVVVLDHEPDGLAVVVGDLRVHHRLVAVVELLRVPAQVGDFEPRLRYRDGRRNDGAVLGAQLEVIGLKRRITAVVLHAFEAVPHRRSLRVGGVLDLELVLRARSVVLGHRTPEP